MAVSSGKVTFADLDSILGLEDLEDIVEIVSIDAHNARIIAKRQKPK
jgi:hypothetical protein